MAYKALKVEKVDAATFNRSEQNTQTAFEDLSATPLVPVLVVTATQGLGQYQVKTSDVFVVVDARGGPMKIVLYPPSGITQVVSVLNAYSANKVTIAQSDGKQMGGLSIMLESGKSIQMVNTGKGWFAFGG